MKKNYLSKEEDSCFSRLVIDCNTSPDTEEKRKRLAEIKERTKILIYRVSQEILHMSKDEASSVYVEMNKDLDRIISSYRISSATYNQYLKQLCQYRARRMRREKGNKGIWERAFLMEEINWAAHYSSAYDFTYGIGEEELSTLDMDTYSNMNMENLFFHIINNKDRPDYPIYNEMEEKLRKALMKVTTRKRFLILILFIPKNTSGIESSDLARVLQTDESAIQKLLEMKEEYVGSNNTGRYGTALDRANKHWRIMAKLKKEISMERNEERKLRLQDHYHTQVKCHRQRIIEARKINRGMTRTEIAEILGMSRSTVCTAIVKMTEKLKEIILTSSLTT